MLFKHFSHDALAPASYLVVDTRSAAAFAGGDIPDPINIPASL